MNFLENGFTLEQKSTFLHIAGGVLVGIASGVMTKDPWQIGNQGAVLFMFGIMSILYFIATRGLKLRSQETPEKKYGIKWYLSNGIYPYVVFWLLAWIAIYNI